MSNSVRGHWVFPSSHFLFYVYVSICRQVHQVCVWGGGGRVSQKPEASGSGAAGTVGYQMCRNCGLPDVRAGTDLHCLLTAEPFPSPHSKTLGSCSIPGLLCSHSGVIVTDLSRSNHFRPSVFSGFHFYTDKLRLRLNGKIL